MSLKPDYQMTYTICQGCPASGKSTWANEEIDKSKSGRIIRVNRDDVRRELFDFGQWPEYKFTKSKEDKVTDHINSAVRKAAALGKSVIDDNTNLNPKYLKKTQDFAESLGFKVEFKQFFDVPLHKLIERNLYRKYSVGEDVVHRMFRAQLKLQDRIIKSTEGLPECVIVDVDGTIADMGKGEKWGRMPYDWGKVSNDKPKKNVVDFVRFLYATDGIQIIFLTGRDGCALSSTRGWIINHIFKGWDVFNEKYGPELYIRTAGDMRPDCDIKEEILRNKVLPRYNVKFCLDDRNQMVDHWRALGLECWQVDAGRF